MSNLQDIPLAEPESMPTIDQDTTGTKSNSLKRFFKLVKKHNNTSQESINDMTEAENETNNKDAAKLGSISRFLTRFKGTSKTDTTEPTSSSTTAIKEEVNSRPAPVPNAKPTLKTSISGYWKLLFNRQKAASQRQNLNSVQEPQEAEKALDATELQSKQQEQPTEKANMEEHVNITPATSRLEIKDGPLTKVNEVNELNSLPELVDELHELSVSEEIVDTTLEEPIET